MRLRGLEVAEDLALADGIAVGALRAAGVVVEVEVREEADVGVHAPDQVVPASRAQGLQLVRIP